MLINANIVPLLVILNYYFLHDVWPLFMTVIPTYPVKMHHEKVCQATSNCNALKGIRIAHNSLDFFLENRAQCQKRRE